VSASLYASRRDNRNAELDFKSIRRENGAVILPGTAALMSRNADRSIMVSLEIQSGGSQYLPLKLPASPRHENETWSEWIFATQRANLSPIPEPDRIAVRYRVRPVE
jgi:hypothetical protein